MKRTGTRGSRVAVHWTAHSCLVVDPGIAGPYQPYPPEILEQLTERFNPESLTYGGTWFGCESRRRKPLDPATNRYTTSIGDVTCDRCIERYRELVEVWRSRPRIAGPVGVMLDAHRLCCKGRGAVLAVDRERLAAHVRSQAAYRLRTLFESATCPAWLRMYDHDAITKAAGSLPVGLREPLRTAIDELSMAADLVAEVVRLQQRAEAAVRAAADRISTGEVEIAEPDLRALLEGEREVSEDAQQLAKVRLEQCMAELKVALAEADALAAEAA